jgi:hypothetical protein
VRSTRQDRLDTLGRRLLAWAREQGLDIVNDTEYSRRGTCPRTGAALVEETWNERPQRRRAGHLGTVIDLFLVSVEDMEGGRVVEHAVIDGAHHIDQNRHADHSLQLIGTEAGAPKLEPLKAKKVAGLTGRKRKAEDAQRKAEEARNRIDEMHKQNINTGKAQEIKLLLANLPEEEKKKYSGAITKRLDS